MMTNSKSFTSRELSPRLISLLIFSPRTGPLLFPPLPPPVAPLRVGPFLSTWLVEKEAGVSAVGTVLGAVEEVAEEALLAIEEDSCAVEEEDDSDDKAKKVLRLWTPYEYDSWYREG